ncbi:acylamino-acid-releasing enzyme-like isoform X5 [Opisthocomus hoazin]|uniref:acylamino-acid-releasing enzyme-like isoform X5 n=1 Tax=Opisthocomus hoazin TaxID=30419 RepID=UPI003F52B32B
MAAETERGAEAPGSPAACYRELSQFAAVTRAALGAAAEGQTFLLHAECSRPDLPRRRLLRFSRHYSLWRDGDGGLAVSRAALSAEIHNQLLSQDSPTGQHRAVLSCCPRQGHELLEVWDSSGRSHSVDLTALGKHGEVYTEGRAPSPHPPPTTQVRAAQPVVPVPALCPAGLWHPLPVPGPFACLAWSRSETQLLYVAEKSWPKPQSPCPWDVPGAARPVEEDEDEEGEQFLYREDWGEALGTRSVPVLCVLDMEGSSVSVLEGVPEHLSPGQALWSPGDTGVLFVGWWHEPFRLGLSACSNRRSGIFHLDLGSGHCAHLADEADSDSARRGAGAHGGLRRALRGGTATAVLGSRQPASRAGHPAAEPHGPAACGHGGGHCHQPDGRVARRVLGAAHPPVGPAGGHLLSPEPSPQPGGVGTAAGGPGAAPLLGAGGGHPDGAWRHLEDPDSPAALQWAEPRRTRTGTQAFEALLLSPLDGAAPHPLVVCPHGGPHAVFDARWRPSMAALCRLGFAVLLVNYRGSLGFGQASISSLLSCVGVQDVEDTQLAVEQALRSEPLDPHRLALLAGSHGAFIALHLLAREPERYQACALRSPVSNLPALLGTSDIPDWRYTSLGLPYSFERVPRAEEVAAMLQRSPIAQAAQVRTPVLLCVGARDRRVSPTQALELYRVLRARGVPARLLWYPEGGHALAGVETEADVFRNCARWLLRHLGQPRRDGTAPCTHGGPAAVPAPR